MQLIANISMLFTEAPLVERIGLAADAGFDGVEIQFPYGEDIDDLRRASIENAMPIELINLPAGDWQAGDRGLAALSDRQDEFDRSVELCAEWASALAVKKINVLAGIVQSEAAGGDNLTMLIKNLRHVAERFSGMNIDVQMEVINPFDVPGFIACDLETGLNIIAEVNHRNLYLQFDFYHMARTQNSLDEAIKRAGAAIGHVQFADNPGRHQPGTGSIDFTSAMAALKSTGYRGAVSAEYMPLTTTHDSLGWMQQFHELI